jgi:hypothetical protein
VTVTSVPLGLGSKPTSTSVFSSCAKLTPRHSTTAARASSRIEVTGILP